MKIALYIILGLLFVAACVAVWFFFIFFKVPSLKMPPNASEEERIKALDKWFEKLQEQHKFNGVVLIGKEGKVQLAKGYGYTDHRRDQKLTEHSSLRLASVSKQFTATGILLLKQQGKLDLDDAVADYITNFPYEGVSIRHLLNQTSGIPDSYMELAHKNKASIPLLTNEIATDLLIREGQPATHPPNEVFHYSNTNYILLGRLIEIIAGTSIEAFLQDNLFDPLGMQNTRVWNLRSADSTFANKADDFQIAGKQAFELESTFLDGVAGDGAVFSSAMDLLTWDQFWNGNSLISDDILQEAFQRPVLNNGSTSDYGFGWMVTDKGMWHNGAWQGANTIFMRNTEQKSCIAILDNSSNLFFNKLLQEFRTSTTEKK
ncbi:MAG: serine hydrolase domain-containing protein [Bacteroidota bacterium]